MHQLAKYDALTGVKNKNAYEEEIELINDDKVGFAIIDLNNLKIINDQYGHDKGDIAIKNLADLISDVFKYSSVYRIGGDEFAIILLDYDYNHIDELMDEINNKFNE